MTLSAILVPTVIDKIPCLDCETDFFSNANSQGLPTERQHLSDLASTNRHPGNTTARSQLFSRSVRLLAQSVSLCLLLMIGSNQVTAASIIDGSAFARRPNILLIMTDQQRFDSLGCYGAKFVHTPNLDRLAKQGVLFENNYVNATICTPSRASLLTGKEMPEHGVYRLYDNLPKDEVLFPERLLAAGYETALFGKLHVSALDTESNERIPHDGFERYEPCIEGIARMEAPYQAYSQWLKASSPEFYKLLLTDGRNVKHVPMQWHMTHWAANRTIDFLEHHDSARPFFAMMSVFEPHNPYDGYPAEMSRFVDKDKIPAPISAIDPNEPTDIGRERSGSYLGAFDKFSPKELQDLRHDYFAAVSYTDLEIGRVLKRLDELGLAENTLVIFTSDHGDQLGDHRLLVKGAALFEDTVRVPLLMRWPRELPAGRRVNGLVQLNDIAATVLDAARLDHTGIAAAMPDARSLIPLATGRIERVHDYVVCAYRNSGINDKNRYWDPPIHAEMIRNEQFKLTLYHDTSGIRGGRDQGQLFSLKDDPNETNNLWTDPSYAEVRKSLTLHLSEWNRRWDKFSPSRGGETPPRVLMQNSLK